MKKFRKFLSILVVATMLFSLLSTTAYSAGEESLSVTYDSVKNYLYANGIPVLIKESEGNTYMYDISGTTRLFEKPLEEVYYVFGASQTGTVANTKLIMESGSIGTRTTAKKGYLYAGGGGAVEGLAEVIVKGGFADTVYGSGSSGTTGNVRIEYNNTSSNLQALVCGTRGIVTGNIDIVLNNPNLTTLCGGSNGGATAIPAPYVGGDINITINGGSIANIYGGCTAGKVYGEVNITINGDTQVSTAFHPMRKTMNDFVDGGANVYVPESFDSSIISTTYGKGSPSGVGSPNNKICIFKNGIQVYGPKKVTSDTNGNVFANGVAVTIKAAQDGKTYIYDKSGTMQLLKFPIDNYTVYGGCFSEPMLGANINMESGRLSAIYGGGLNGSVSGSTFVTINGGVVDSVYAGGLNGTVNATAYIKIGEGASVTGTAPSVRAGSSDASVIWVPDNFDMSKILRDENVRIFKGSIEVPDTSIRVPDKVTEEGNFIFANGITVVIKKDAADGRTYVYDAKGNKKLLSTEVNGHEIYGGSSKGVVESTSVTMESGTVLRIYGGGYKACVSGAAKVSVTGGDITEVIYGGSYDGDVGSTNIYTNGPYVAKGVNAGSRNGCVLGDTNVVLVDSVAKGLYAGTGGDGRVGCPNSDVLGNVSLTLDGGMAEKIYGGCKSGVVKGTSTITVIGQALIKTGIIPQGNGGVLGGATVIVPENYLYMDKITTGEGISIQLTQAVEPEPAPVMGDRIEKVMSTEGDDGKLVYRFIDLPAPEGIYTGRYGEAIYITFPDGKNMLVDAAAPDTTDILINFLRQMNVTKLDYIVATHYHSDHIGGLYRILDEFDVGTLYKPGFNIPKESKDYYTELKARIDNPDRTFTVADLWSGDILNIGGVEIEILNPVNDPAVIAVMNGTPSTEDTNNNSVVMKMTYGENTALLTGDLYTAGEFKLLEAYKGTDKLKADLVKVPHHGDTTSSDPEFVAAVAPEIAVITHFSDTIIVNNRYRSVGADTYVTGIEGIVKVSFDGLNADVMTQFFNVKSGIDSLSMLIDKYAEKEELKAPLGVQLTQSLTRAGHQIDIGRLDQAVKHLEDFIKHLNNKAFESSISNEAKEALSSDAYELMKLILMEQK